MTNKIQNKMKLAALAVYTAGILAGCSKGEAPSQFRTLQTPFVGGSHFESAETVACVYNGGVKKYGLDLDIDGDRMNDLYVLCNDGTLYNTCSRRLIDGEDNSMEKTWMKNSSSALEGAIAGEYGAFGSKIKGAK